MSYQDPNLPDGCTQQEIDAQWEVNPLLIDACFMASCKGCSCGLSKKICNHCMNHCDADGNLLEELEDSNG